MPALFVYQLTATTVRKVEAEWRSYRQAILKLAEVDREELPENKAWNWVEKRSQIDEEHGGVCGVIAEAKVQGMAMYSFATVPGRTTATSGSPMLYVEYLETAPFNLVSFVGQHARFGGVGTQLLNGLMDVSRHLDCQGRLALHTLPSARTFYEEQGFVN